MRPQKTSPSPVNLNPGEDTLSPHRKPVRRRGQARKPYHQKLVNMAEARREIVTALKLHREKKHPGPEIETRPEHHRFGPLSAEQEARLKSRRNPRIYASSYYVNNRNGYIPDLYSSPYYSRPDSSSAIPPLLIQENSNFVDLPNQTLGLNLNLQDFNNLDTSFINYSSVNSSSIYNSSLSSPSTSCSPALSVAAEEVTNVDGAPSEDTILVGDDRHKTGWGDELNFGISAERAEFLEPIGVGPDQELVTEDFAVSSPFDEVMEIPAAWVNSDDSCVGNVCGGGDYFQDHALPCMDIGEIEGIDEDWLA
ncbi:hypothetical protein CASFOL_022207 [Castilleja foliolosa]|uniref:Uncharacterized protein n=1 Tax=Castilleja foliolosa TaxID=1961234 RepID=A0ABD3CXR8_9LAMI